jgi:hypothetical protein
MSCDEADKYSVDSLAGKIPDKSRRSTVQSCVTLNCTEGS